MKNPTILEGGIARVFSGIRKLFTRQSGSDDMIAWVPESDRQLTTKYITQNGVYRAADDGYYAYSSVTVSVPTDTGVTGEGEDGEQHYVAPDPETGELVDEVIPSSIQIVTPPSFVGPYGDGAYISFEGIEVKAYLASGEVWEDESHPGGAIPVSELTFPVTVTEYDEEAGPVIEKRTSDLDLGPVPQPVPCAGTEVIVFSGNPVSTVTFVPIGNSKFTACKDARNYAFVIIAGVSPTDGYSIDNLQNISYLNLTHTVGGKTVYYAVHSWLNTVESLTPDLGVTKPDNVYIPLIAWTMIYGDLTGSSGGVQIPVEWQRVGDGAVLDDSFGITVVDIAPGNEGD